MHEKRWRGILRCPSSPPTACSAAPRGNIFCGHNSTSAKNRIFYFINSLHCTENAEGSAAQRARLVPGRALAARRATTLPGILATTAPGQPAAAGATTPRWAAGQGAAPRTTPRSTRAVAAARGSGCVGRTARRTWRACCATATSRPWSRAFGPKWCALPISVQIIICFADYYHVYILGRTTLKWRRCGCGRRWRACAARCPAARPR